ncbi:lipid-A-disaccharide synthase [Megasphaera vaginalis (ex Bordigoni et al. 2020)]|uniref:lipid-A-disaccharide synthase n=1 Tax=Megasphaera vaginalis (ex Bordigoni et al. 2020) TaxID=2045301 RepID=UPI000C7E2B87|nr:lipid-A-disaccharide synthase [Megasphaera vaginalis (ex Bordigoni et al. 2020)]
MKIMLSAGEASGDLHGANLASALKKLEPSVELIGMGGSQMAAAGVDIRYDIKNLGFIGIGEIIKKIPFFFRLRSFLVKLMAEERPDALVCIDYPGFNMRLIKKAKAAGIPVIYYILPTIWAWQKGRGPVIAKYTDLAVSLFPFEADLYRAIGANVIYTGHPLLDTVRPALTKAASYAYFGLSADKPVVLLMPGSRMQEVTGLLPTMLEGAKLIAEAVPEVQFIMPRASTIDGGILRDLVAASGLAVHIGEDHTYDMMQISSAAVVASGTATLETALMAVPTLLVYRIGALSYALSKILVHIESIGLPNIIMGRRIIPELWQDEVTGENIAAAVVPLLQHETQRQTAVKALAAVRAEMGEGGSMERTAAAILRFIKEKSLDGTI